MANRFWVGGTGDLDGSTTTHIAASSNGAGGQSYPGSGDTLTFDANSGGGTVTVTAPHTLQSISMGAFTGTWDNSGGNHAFTLTAATGFNGSGTGVRTINLGSATYTCSASNATFSFATSTNLTLTASSANIVLSGGGGATFSGGAKTYGSLSFGTTTSLAAYEITGANTFGQINITAPNYIQFSANQTITNAFNWAGSSGSAITIISNSPVVSVRTIAAAASSVASWCAFRSITFTGSPSATNSFDLGQATGITITPPSGGTTAARVIGS